MAAVQSEKPHLFGRALHVATPAPALTHRTLLQRTVRWPTQRCNISSVDLISGRTHAWQASTRQPTGGMTADSMRSSLETVQKR